MNKEQLQSRASAHLEAKIFFAKKEVEQRELELEGIIPTKIDADLVAKCLRADERKLETLEYMQRLVMADIDVSDIYE